MTSDRFDHSNLKRTITSRIEISNFSATELIRCGFFLWNLAAQCLSAMFTLFVQLTSLLFRYSASIICHENVCFIWECVFSLSGWYNEDIMCVTRRNCLVHVRGKKFCVVYEQYRKITLRWCFSTKFRLLSFCTPFFSWFQKC